MMKYLSITLIGLLLLSACADDSSTDVSNDAETEVEQTKDNFTISGNITGASNMVFYLEAQSPQGMISVAQATADANGTFKMVNNIPGFGMYQLRMGEDPKQVVLLTLVPGDDLKLTASTETFAKSPQAEGTSWAGVMSEYIQRVDQFRVEQEALNSDENISADDLAERYMELKNEMDQFALGKMKADPSNPFNLVLSTYAIPTMDFVGWNSENLDVLKLVSDAYIKAYPNSPMSTTLSNQVYQIELAYNQFLANSSGTRPAPEIALKNPEGKEIRLSSLQGNYVLIDFWASWCAPCRRENPNVVALYKKYKDQGFTVYSVSLDNDPIAWKQAIEKDGLIWPNHVSDLLQWKSPLPSLYGFNGIPHTVLVNKEGNIIGTGLRGEALEQKLKEIFEN